jgi:hypothetical protein
MTARPRPTAARILGRIALSLGFTVLLLEILLRFIWIFPFTAKGAFLCRDEVADHGHYEYGVGRMRAREFNVVLRMNNIGMRDDDVALVKPPGVRRIIALGDSFMEGWGCERGEIFTDVLEDELKSEGVEVEVVAAGVSSWSTLTALAWLKHRGLAFQPDAILFAFDATDPAGDSFYARRLVRDAEGRPDHIRRGRRRFDLPIAWHNRLARHSHIFRYVDRFLTKKLPVTESDYGYWTETDDVWAPLRGPEEIPDDLYASYWTHTREAMIEMTRLADERGIPLLIFQYPAGVEVDTSAWAEGRSTARFEPGVISPRRFEYMERMASADSLPYFGLLDDFKAHPEPKSLYFDYDGHWSAAGHRFVAGVIAREMLRRGMI